MKNKLLKLIVLGMIVIGSVCGLLPQVAYAADDPFCDNLSDAAEEVRRAAGCDNGNSKDAFKNTIKNILEAIIGMAGLVAVVFIVIGGVQYMTSTGDPNKIKKAKDTILYAVIGLIICALAFGIVNWAVGVINDSPDKTAIINNSLAFLIK